MSDCEVFLSYRRGANSPEAQQIRAGLTARGIAAFRDVDDVRGRFREELDAAIRKAGNFVVLVDKDTLDGCASPDDWLGWEIERAILYDRHVVPVLLQPGLATIDAKALPQKLRRLADWQAAFVAKPDLFGDVRRQRAAIGAVVRELLLEPPTTVQVYVSAATEDHAPLGDLADVIAEHGISVWPTRSSVQDWRELQAWRVIQGAKALVLMRSPAALRCDRVAADISYTWRARRPGIALPVSGRDLYGLPPSYYTAAIPMADPGWREQLIDRLRGAGCRADGPRAAPPLERNPAANPVRPVPPLTPATALASSDHGHLDELLQLATLTDRIWPVRPGQSGPAGVRGLGEKPGATLKFHLGEKLQVVIDVGEPGHLLLLDAGPEGTIYCLCPSNFARETYMPRGSAVLPQPTAQFPWFQLGGNTPGPERLLAIVSKEPPPFDWSPPDGALTRTLRKEDLLALLEWLRAPDSPPWRGFATSFDVLPRRDRVSVRQGRR